jgi:hypothetical protein
MEQLKNGLTIMKKTLFNFFIFDLHLYNRII